MFALIGIAGLLLFGLIVMGLWNAILPSVLNISTISFGQALGILILSKILFSGFHRGSRGGWGGRRRQHWKQHMEEKWKNMSPEERQKFQQNWRNRCSQWTQPVNPEEKGTD